MHSGWEHTPSDAATSVVLPRRAVASPQLLLCVRTLKGQGAQLQFQKIQFEKSADILGEGFRLPPPPDQRESCCHAVLPSVRVPRLSRGHRFPDQ